MKNQFKKLRTLLCLLLVLTMLAPNTTIMAYSKGNNFNSLNICSNALQMDTGSYAVLQSEPAVSNSDAKKSIEEIAAEKAKVLTDMYGITSLQLSILDNGKFTLSSEYGYSDKKTKKVPDKNTIYGIGSVSKVYTTAAVMQLVDQGKVDLDKPVTTYIPDFKMADSRYKDITVRMLLNHSSGLMGSTFRNAMLLGEASTENYDNFLTYLKSQHLKYNPGSSSVYCNDGFSLAEILVSRVSGMSFTQYIEKEISAPLGLTNTLTPQSKFDTKRLAKTYDDNRQETPYETINAIGAGGIYSTAEELCKFGSSFVNGSNQLVSSSSVSAMGKAEYSNGFWPDGKSTAIAYGLGWDSVKFSPYSEYGITAYVKGGDTQLYHGSMTVLPEYNMVISALSSSGSSTALEMFTNCVMMEYLSQKGIVNLKDTSAAQPAYETTSLPADVNNYTGIYASTSSSIKVSAKKDILTINLDGQAIPFQYTKEGYYVDSSNTVKVRFVTHDNNTYIEWEQNSIFPYLGNMNMVCYLGEKLNSNPLSEKVKKVWQKRNGKTYYLVTEKYTSGLYWKSTLDSVKMPINFSSDADGYLYNMQIKSANNCYHNLEIPVMYGRDGADITFYKKNGVEYANSLGNIYMSEDGIKALPNKRSAKVKIAKNGYNIYYKISSKTAGKKATITVPKNASFIVYGKDGSEVNNYYISKTKTVTLPKGGTLLLLGNKNAAFKITLK